MNKPYLVFYDKKLWARCLTLKGALAKVGELTLKGFKGPLFELRIEKDGMIHEI